MTITREVDPVSRIEGHLGLTLTVDGTTSGFVTDCDAHGNLWRGFENFLIDRTPNDAITFTQRICGVCPLPHATASTFAVDSIFGYSDSYITFANDGSHAAAKGVPQKAVHIRNLVYACEFLMSHITHFYHLVALSYVQGPKMPPWTPYFHTDYYHPYLLSLDRAVPDPTKDVSLWGAVIRQYVHALRVRRLTFEAGSLFAGRMPMTSSFVAGGVTYPAGESATAFQAKCDAMWALLKEVGDFIITEYVPLVLALGALYPNYDNFDNADWLNTAASGIWAAGNQSGVSTPTSGAGANTGWGAGCGNFLAWGAFPQPNVANQVLAIGGGWKYGTRAGMTPSGSGSGTLCTGVSNVATAINTVKSHLVEDISHSRYASGYGYSSVDVPAYPGDVTRTEPHRANGYSWLKAPRWKADGTNLFPMEVGPLARLAVNDLYPVNGDTIAGTLDLTAFGMTDYLDYVSGSGLDSRMVSSDLLTGLVNAGATVTNGVSNNDGNDISGAVTLWIINLKGGLSTMDRLRGRALESLYLVQCMIGGYDKTLAHPWGTVPGGWLGALRSLTTADTYNPDLTLPGANTKGFGVSEAPRGALAHFITASGNKITAYQCVVPTTWNGSPKDNADTAGPIEQAVIGSQYANRTATIRNQANTADIVCEGGVEQLRIAQSFDPCIACSVH